MKIEKNKIVFGAVLGVVVIFLISYSILVMSGDDIERDNLKQTLVPELKQEQEDYSSKLDAINDLKKVRETNAPSIYDEKLLDSLGFYDPDLLSKDKQRLVDSIYSSGKIDYAERSYRNRSPQQEEAITQAIVDTTSTKAGNDIQVKEIGLGHQLFFASDPQKKIESSISNTDVVIQVAVDGNQIVKGDYRLRMRLTEDALVNNRIIPKNTPVFGFISFKSNRAMIEIKTIDHQPISLKAYDLEDGSEGIYIENSFRAEAQREVLEDLVDDINISGVPQVSGIQKIFQRSNRKVKVMVVNNYKLILKPAL